MKNMSAWKKELSKYGIEIDVEEDRVRAIKRLINSGLPTYEHHFLGFDELHKLPSLYEKFTRIVIRACPQGNLLRHTIIGKSLKEAMAELSSIKEKKLYTLIVNEYEPAIFCGVIISEEKRLIIEMVKDENLEMLCHGEVTPYSGEFSIKPPFSYPRMFYYPSVPGNVKLLMWNTVKSISLREDENIFKPRKGYFEFVLTPKLKFIDYVPLYSNQALHF